MRLGVVLCAVTGHRWHVDEASTEVEPVLRCDRCRARQLAPSGSAFDRRLAAKAGRDRVLGPGGR
jgi:hypothetical protein